MKKELAPYLIKQEPEGWLVQDTEGQRMVKDMTIFIHGLFKLIGCLVALYIGFALWLIFSSPIKAAVNIVLSKPLWFRTLFG